MRYLFALVLFALFPFIAYAQDAATADPSAPVWLQVILGSLPVLATILVSVLKAIGVFKDEKRRDTLYASAVHGYGFVEEMKRIHGGKTLDKTAEFLGAFREAMTSQGLGAPTAVEESFALSRAKSLHSADKAREVEVEKLAKTPDPS